MRVGSGAVSGYPRPSHTAPVPLRDVAAVAGAQAVPPGDVMVRGVTHDSTMVRPGDLYAALPGARRHGAEFAAQASSAGAVAILTDPAGAGLLAAGPVPVLVVEDPRAVLGTVASRVYGDPSQRLPIIGITGTAGKTSTAYLVESGLRAAGHTTCMIGTVETRVAEETLSSVRTTPEATDLHALLATALERGVTAAVMEVSSHALSYGRVNGVRFAVGAWTNFGLDHLDFHGGVEEYYAAKARLFDGRCRVEILNRDDPAVARLATPGRLTFSVSCDPAADPAATWQATQLARDGFAQTFVAIGPGEIREPARVALPGRHNVANALLAIACLVASGVDPATAAKGVAECRGVPGRLELVPAPGPVLGVVDYAHKPDAIAAALAALREITSGRLICVLGAGGDRDRVKRPLMGAAAVHGADLVIVTDDNPRTEDAAAIRAEVLAGTVAPSAGEAADHEVSAAGEAADHEVSAGEVPRSWPQDHDRPAEAADRSATVLEIAGRREAIALAVARARPGDIVAVLGKGHEVGQEVDGVTVPFDDRVELTAALQARWAGLPA